MPERTLAWFKSGLQLRGGWGRRPKGNAPRSEASALGAMTIGGGMVSCDGGNAPRYEASALGARWLLPARSQPPNYRHLRGWQRGVVTPHAPMTLGANHVSRAPERG